MTHHDPAMTDTAPQALAEIAGKLTGPQRRMLLASEPGGWGRDDTATGVEIRGADYRVAASLEAKGLGDYGHGSPYGDLYFNNADGLAIRSYLMSNSEGKE